MSAPRGARERVRAELTQEIKEAARRQLAAHGAAALSLRAVARDLDMAPSALYRYFASRDDLLTALITDAYNDLGDVVDAADRSCPRTSFTGRWMAIGRALRRWALVHRHEYALLYGSPVPGYRAPGETVGPGTRVSAALARVVAEAEAAGALRHRPLPSPIDDDSVPDLLQPGLRDFVSDLDPVVVVRAIAAWTALYGMVSFELFGQLVGMATDDEGLFEEALALGADLVGLPGAEDRGATPP